jgi:2-keto-4-pentenoate hydratase
MLDVDAPVTLARCRRAGTISHIALHELESRAAAEAFQMAGIKALGGEPCGYKIGATSVEVQRLLKCQGPMHAPIMREDVLPNGATFRIPPGLLGIECELALSWAAISQSMPKIWTSRHCNQLSLNVLSRWRLSVDVSVMMCPLPN